MGPALLRLRELELMTEVTLWPHQIAAADRIRRGDIRALFWSMRCGKTLAAIAGTDDGDRLIVCPNSVKGVWLNDLGLWGQDAYLWESRGKRPADRPRNVIVNYETFWRTELLAWNWDSIVFDESLRLQNIRTKLWQYVSRHRLALAESRVVLLSGTPCPEGYHQLISQSIVASGQYCGETDPWAALRKYFTYDDRKYKWKLNPGHAAQAKTQLAALGPSMTQEEAGLTCRKLYRSIQIPLGEPETAAWLSAPVSESAAIMGLYAQSAASGRTVAGVTASSTKLDAVAEYVRDLDGQCVVLTRFTSSLRYLADRFPVAALIYGGDHPEERAAVIKRFSDGKIKVIIANVATVKVGLNLSAADTLIFAENSFSGETRIQAEERATVRGKVSVEIVDFLTVGDGPVGLVDRYVLSSVRQKKDFNSRMLTFTRGK